SPVSVNAPTSVSASYVSQYRVSFAQSGLGTTGANTVVTVGASTFTKGVLSDTRFWDAGTAWAFESTVNTDPASGTRYNLTSTPASGTIAAADRGSTITGTYGTQYQISFAQSGIGGDTSATVVTVDGADKTAANLPFSKFVNAGTSVGFSYQPTVATSSDADKRYRRDSVDTTSPVSVNAPTSVSASYVSQYRVSFAQSGLGTTGANTVVSVGASTFTKGALSDTRFWDAGTAWAFESTVNTDPASGTRYNLTSTPASGTIAAADRGSTITGTYGTQYQISFAQSGIGGDTSATVVTVDGADKTAANLPFSKFVNAGTSVGFSYQPTVATSSDADKRYRRDSVDTTSPVSVNAPTSVSASYVSQYRVSFAQSGLGTTGANTVVTV